MRRSDLPTDRALVALGANLGAPLDTLPEALRSLALLPATRLVGHSRAYRTEPFGTGEPQPDYWNAACELEFSGDPRRLLERLHHIEREFGRNRRREGRHGARTLDLDLLLHGARTSDGAELRLPHPGLELRLFVLAPLCDLRPDLVLPSGATAADRARALREQGQALLEAAELCVATEATVPISPAP